MSTMSLAEAAGLDVWRCEFCDGKVRKDRRYITGMDGMRAHPKCVKAYLRREEARARRYSRYPRRSAAFLADLRFATRDEERKP